MTSGCQKAVSRNSFRIVGSAYWFSFLMSANDELRRAAASFIRFVPEWPVKLNELEKLVETLLYLLP
jgi:hypothetical protein